jgi:hypothetical protein
MLGVHGDSTNHAEVARLLRSHCSKPGDVLVSLNEYIVRVEDGLIDVFYISGAGITAASSSPFLEDLRKEGPVGLYMVAPVDALAVRLRLCSSMRHVPAPIGLVVVGAALFLQRHVPAPRGQHGASIAWFSWRTSARRV